MARRYQIIKKTDQGIMRATCQTREELELLVVAAQRDPSCRYIVVKDRYLRTRGLVWRRNRGEEIDWWVLEPKTPEITFKKKPRAEKN